MTRQPGLFTKKAVTLERNVEKLLPRWEMNGYKRAIDHNWGRMAIIRFLGQKPKFRFGSDIPAREGLD